MNFSFTIAMEKIEESNKEYNMTNSLTEHLEKKYNAMYINPDEYWNNPQFCNFVNDLKRDISSKENNINLSNRFYLDKDEVIDEFKVCIVGDYDVDGILSTIGMKHILEDFYVSNITIKNNNRFSSTGYGISESLIGESSKYNIMIFLDIGTTYMNIIEKMGCKVYIIDHHLPPINLNIPENCKLLNPQCGNMTTLKKLSTGGLVLGISRVLSLNKEKYMFLAITLLSDCCNMDTNTDDGYLVFCLLRGYYNWIEKAIDIYKHCGKYPNNISQVDSIVLTVFNRGNAKYTKYINSTFFNFDVIPLLNAFGRMPNASVFKIALKYFPQQVKNDDTSIDILIKIYSYLLNNKGNKYLLNQYVIFLEKVNDSRKIYQQNIINRLNTYIDNTQCICDISHTMDDIGIVGIIASKDKRMKICGIYNSVTKEYILSLRKNQSYYNCGLMCQMIVECGIGSKGGGHKEAAGITIPEDNWNKFINKIKRYTVPKEFIDVKVEKYINNIPQVDNKKFLKYGVVQYPGIIFNGMLYIAKYKWDEEKYSPMTNGYEEIDDIYICNLQLSYDTVIVNDDVIPISSMMLRNDRQIINSTLHLLEPFGSGRVMPLFASHLKLYITKYSRYVRYVVMDKNDQYICDGVGFDTAISFENGVFNVEYNIHKDKIIINSLAQL